MTAPATPGSAAAKNSHRASFWATAAFLLAIIVVLFFRSFLPQYCLFSNDGPLGANSAEYAKYPDGFAGAWQDLNWLGKDGGSFVPNLSQGLMGLLGPLGAAKFYVPLTLLVVGLCAWFFLRQLKLSPLACVLGALAAGLNSDFFSTTCWGVGPQTICFGMNYLALGAVVGEGGRFKWLRYALAGFAVGLGVTEGADIGAIFSMFVAAFVLYHAWVSEPTPARRIGIGIARLILVAGFAAFIAAQALSALTGTAIKGIAGAEETQEAKAGRWDWATQWSLPKREALSLLVPGLFGFRMDTAEGGNYWGAAGRDAAWDRYFESDRQGPPPNPSQHFIRYAGGGIYAGVLVILVAAWAGFQSFRKDASVFSPANRKLIWFWLAVMLISLLLAFGKYAPFYQFFYALPRASAIRNPAKFLHIFSWALLIVFAFGIHGLSRRYLETAAASIGSLGEHLRNWWAKVRGFERNWTAGCVLAVALSLIGWLIYGTGRKGLEDYLQIVLFDPETAKAIAGFSFRAVGWYVLFLILSVGTLTLVLSGWFAGRRSNWAGILLGVLLVADLARANLPWIVYWDYKQKYASNPVIDFLRDKPYQQRVAIFSMKRHLDVSRLPREAEPLIRMDEQIGGLYGIEWQQHLFLYYNIQSLDIIQEPRVATDKIAYEAALIFTPLRRWELTNTRYLIAPVAMLDFLNRQMDPGQKRFRVATQFDIAPKPGITNPSRYEHLTTVLNTNGQYAVIEFTGALPRAKLLSNWQVSTNEPAQLKDWLADVQKRLPADWGTALAGQTPTDLAILKQLADPGFDPAQTVLLAEPLAATSNTNQNPAVQFDRYAPKHIVLRATATAPAVLLLNDKYDPNWKVFVDGKPEKLLRANFAMRAVALQPGEHKVEFKFEPPIDALYVSLSAIGVGIILLGIVFLGSRRESAAENSPAK